MRLQKGQKYTKKINAKASREARKPGATYKDDPTEVVFKTH